MRHWKRILLLILVMLTILSLLLSACGPVEKLHGNANGEKEKDGNNGKEKIKDKEDKGGNAYRITICHKTGSAKHPYAEIRVPNDVFKDGHAKHAGDLIPAPEDGCPVK
jgi:protein involved in sex pheromone biosynthesis